jgi:hypothetical protein
LMPRRTLSELYKMYTYKRKTKINKNQRNNKRRLIAFYTLTIGSSLLFAAGIIFVLTMQSQKPLLVSPIPMIKALANGSHDDEQTAGIKKLLKEKSIAHTGVEVKDSFYIISLENGGEVTLSAKKDIITQISSLQFILARLTMEGRQFRKLDLQFDKPIIVFKE